MKFSIYKVINFLILKLTISGVVLGGGLWRWRYDIFLYHSAKANFKIFHSKCLENRIKIFHINLPLLLTKTAAYLNLKTLELQI